MADERPVVQEVPLDPSKTNEQEVNRPPGRKALGGPYGLKALKTFPGMESTAFDAVLTRGNKPVAHIHDDGNGGALFVSWADRKGGLSADEEIFDAFIEEERAKIPADKMFHGMPERQLFSGDVFLGNLLNEALLDRRWRRAVRTHTLFQVEQEIGTGEWKQVKGTEPEIRAHIAKKYAGKKIRIINDEYQGT